VDFWIITVAVLAALGAVGAFMALGRQPPSTRDYEKAPR